MEFSSDTLLPDIRSKIAYQKMSSETAKERINILEDLGPFLSKLLVLLAPNRDLEQHIALQTSQSLIHLGFRKKIFDNFIPVLEGLWVGTQWCRRSSKVW